MASNKISFNLIVKYYEVLFYWSFINFKREERLIKFLTDKGFEVKRSNLILDAIFKVDLIAVNENIKYLIQLKNQKSNLTSFEIKQIKHFSQLRNGIPLLVYVDKNNFKFLNLFNDEYIQI